jgi:hypothetical protein
MGKKKWFVCKVGIVTNPELLAKIGYFNVSLPFGPEPVDGRPWYS